ncbi:hypothetical protein DY218_27460 [Streptomyces triticagri]|uniref:Uncharacterized protein n=1 Tax=Streptomyces triticagri TaxID=2293568 RepID=A0A372LY90_9ACTN|nr:hypothetical protein [Streptomyces triticagri]RFU83648.1 hypothetical protein DY218_27460 [Streptomyces triticagri]
MRTALAALGVEVPACLPGEDSGCDQSAQGHYLTYLAMLNARVVTMAAANLTGREVTEFNHLANTFYAEYSEGVA